MGSAREPTPESCACDSPVSSVEPSLQSSRCWENWKRSSRAFLAQETRRRCVEKQAGCHRPTAWHNGLGHSQNALGCWRLHSGGEQGNQVPWDGSLEMETRRDQQDQLDNFYCSLAGASRCTRKGDTMGQRRDPGTGKESWQGNEGTWRGREIQPCQPYQPQDLNPCITHMGEGEFSECCVVALLLYLLHQRADHQLGIQAWKPSTGQPSRYGEGRFSPVPVPPAVLPPEMRAVGLCATARTSWLWYWKGFVRTQRFSSPPSFTGSSCSW